jgi:fengycin family lipopeptide synthetase E
MNNSEEMAPLEWFESSLSAERRSMVQGVSIFESFAFIAKSHETKTALWDGKYQLTYLEVYMLVKELASQIAMRKIETEPIAIAIESSVYFPIAMLACLANGCPYVPLDIHMPAERNEMILAQSGASLILTTSNSSFNIGYRESLLVDQLSDFFVDFEPKGSPQDVAYIIYTSGTTGTPKGVFQNQRNLLHDIQLYISLAQITSEDRLTLLYSPSVNGAIRDIFGALLTGATLFIKNLKATSALTIPEFIKNNQITIYHSVPNVFRAFLQRFKESRYYESVRLVYLAGDRIFKSDIDFYKASFSKQAKVYIEIGSTEIATVHSEWFIDHFTEIEHDLVPVGYPVKDKSVAILRKDGSTAKPGEVGEILVSSEYISLGYWKNPELTKTKFSSDGLVPETRTFLTGDLGRMDESGLLTFVGRNDSQTKIDGYRVELSEIEGALMSFSLIQRCCVLPTNGQQNELYAFYQSKREIKSSELRAHLSKSLPAHMIPKKWTWFEELPLNINFKIDYRYLKERLIKIEAEANEERSAAELVRRTWARFLDKDSFDQNLSWKEAGGTSLDAVHFLVQLEAYVKIDLPVSWLNGGMIPSELVDKINNLTPKLKAPFERLIYFPPLGGTSERARLFFRKLSSQFDLYIIRYPSMNEIRQSGYDWKFLEGFIKRQLDKADRGGSHLLSHCNGSNVLFKYLTESGLDISNRFVGIIDSSYKINTGISDRIGLMGRTKRLLLSKRTRYRLIGLLYERLTLTRPLIKWVFSKDFASFEQRRSMRSMFFSQEKEFNRLFYYFYSGGSITEAERHEIMKKSIEYKFVDLEGQHDDILNENNSEKIIKAILDFKGALKQMSA